MNELQVSNGHAMVDPKLMAERINKMHQLMKTVMKADVHYGVIPGCAKPSLFLPGAQVIKLAFKLGTRYSVEDLSIPGEKTYRVTAEVYDQLSGTVLGYGVGECSSSEEKYAWRDAVCEEEFADALEENKRIKYCKGRNGGHYKKTQIRTNPADIANTILKMATKRADIHGTINATAASEVFTQDVEDLPEGMAQNEGSTSSKPSVSPSDVKVSQGDNLNHPSEDERKSGKLISEKQGNLILVKCKENGVSPAAVAKAAGVQNVFWLTWAKNCKTNFEVMLNLVQTKPNSFSKFEPAAQEAKAAAAEQAPEVMGQDDFEKLVFSLLLGCGMSEADLDTALEAELSIKGLKDVKPEDQSKVIDYLTAKQEQARA
jgi:hypothetical protein